MSPPRLLLLLAASACGFQLEPRFGRLLPRQTAGAGPDQGYLNGICSPNSTTPPLPPCISVINIEGQCAPNNTQPLGYLAMQQCLCSAPSSFFADWLGCRSCLYYHGGLSQQALNRYSSVISSVSNAICTGTPTAVFASYFSSINGMVAGTVGSGATTTGDQGVGQTAVSLYYTVTAAQGPGSITGSAAGASRTGGAATSSAAASTTATTSGTGTSSTASRGQATSSASGATASASTTSRSGVMPSAAARLGFVLAAAGGVFAL